MAWLPYWFHAKQALRSGSNELRIQVTNTLANYLISSSGAQCLGAQEGTGMPGPYDARANGFEKQSTASGLFGPVHCSSVSHRSKVVKPRGLCETCLSAYLPYCRTLHQPALDLRKFSQQSNSLCQFPS